MPDPPSDPDEAAHALQNTVKNNLCATGAPVSVTFFTFDQFGYGNFGYAAAASYLLFLAIVALTFVQFRVLGEREEKTS